MGGGKINGRVAVSDLETSGAEAAHSPSSVDLIGGREKRRKAWKGTEEKEYRGRKGCRGGG